ncbi:WD40/YVTN/BNR-like repeat-containing protein [Candidatus Zixiibacteriota bacterium]
MSASFRSKNGMVWCVLLVGLLLLISHACDKSPNGPGDTGRWATRNNGLESLAIQFVAVNPHDSNMLFTGTFDGLYKSSNRGQAWVRIDSGWTYTTVSGVAFDALDEQVVYSSLVGAGVMGSDDRGESWERRIGGLSDLTVYSIVTHPEHSDTVFIGTDGGIWRSIDRGGHWTKMHFYNRAFIAYDPHNSDRLYAGGKYNNFFISADGGSTWTQRSNPDITGGPAVRIQWVLADPVNERTVYAASTTAGLYKITGNNVNWSSLNPGIDSRDVRVVVMDPGNANVLYVATSNGVYRTASAGQSWAGMSNGLTSMDVRALAIDPGGSTLYAGTWGAGVFEWIPE